MFFKDESNQKAIALFLSRVGGANVEDSIRKNRLDVSTEIMTYIHKFPDDWDSRCTFNIKNIGEQFLQLVRNFDANENDGVDRLYVMSYRFLCEFDFLIGAKRELVIDLTNIRNKVLEDLVEMDGAVKSQIIYASYLMPASITKEFINDANIGVFSNFESKKNEAETLKAKWDEELVTKQAEVNELKNKLGEYKIGFNFVGLYKGFSDLCDAKLKEANWLLLFLILMGVIMLAPLIVESFIAYRDMISHEGYDLSHLMVFLPLVSIEIILIYFFRVILINHRSVKGQIIQIELRKTLCQFVQAYADYSAKIKKQDSLVLDKFENLIFSGILSNPEKMPSTFDGLEQIATLVKSVRAPQ